MIKKTIEPIAVEKDETNKEIIDFYKIEVEDLAVAVGHVKDIEIKRKVEQLIKDYQPDRPPKSCVQMKIVLQDNTPISSRPRRLSPKDKDIEGKQIDEWLHEENIRPSKSEFASPIVIVKKKDGSHRICVDYRTLNKKIIKDIYPMPLIEDILEGLEDHRMFTTVFFTLI